MRLTIISDIHANLEALTAVLEDIRVQCVDEILCLGDLVGFGPNPRECVALAMGWRHVLLGDWDQAVLSNSTKEGIIQRQLPWTRQALNVGNEDETNARWEFLRQLPSRHKEGQLLFVHGSPSRPLDEYVFPEDIYNPRKMERIFNLTESTCFMGHTHIPGIFTERGEYFHPAELDHAFPLGPAKSLVNVGSVGQSRDGDPRACYVLLDDQAVCFRRIDYDIDTTIRKLPDLR